MKKRMAVVQLKPHILEYEVKTKEGYEDSRGDFHQGKTEWKGKIKCDAVSSNGKPNEVEFEDGTIKHYSYVIYLDSDVRDFSIGERIRLTLYNGVQKIFSVKGFQRYQLQVKLWV